MEEDLFLVEHPTRYFIKTICKTHILAMWSSQKCNIEWSSLNKQIDWRSIWLYFNHNQKVTTHFTNFKLNQLKSFKIKTLLNELPTHSLYYSIYLKSFSNNNCFYCSSQNSPSHW